MLPPDEQLRALASGCAEILPLEDLRDKLARGVPLVVKLGVDPTAPDLHLGHAVPLRKLRAFQDLGHEVVLIIGDFTARIGDPSGRNTTRPPLAQTEIESNAQTYVDQAFKLLDPARTSIRRNSEWLSGLGFADLLHLASHFTIARVLERDDFQKRHREGAGILLHEFLYPIAQAYDSVVVKADVEIGGTDQLFNLLAGRELMGRLGLQSQVCMTLPLLEGTDGAQKMSKSYDNYIGLTDQPAEMFGKVMSIPDDLMVRYYRLCTRVASAEVDALAESLAKGTAHPGAVKRQLGREIVALYHSEEAAGEAEAAFDRVFKRKEIPAEVAHFEIDDQAVVHIPALLREAGLVVSGTEARRMIAAGAVKIDGRPLGIDELDIDVSRVAGSVIQVGKRRFVRVVRSAPR